MTESLRSALDWGKLGPLRLRARSVAEGVYAGTHRSFKRGSGVEFGGHREYVPGDDLRWLDRRAMMRHGKLLVREFETETDRTLRLVVDASASMAFRSAEAPGAKLAFAALVAAALARVSLSAGDPVSLDWIGGESRRPVGTMGGKEAFEHIVAALDHVVPGGDFAVDEPAIDRALAPIARRARRGSVIVLLSDLVDLPAGAVTQFGALAAGNRTLVVARILDPVEAEFPFEGPVVLRASEGDFVTETDATAARAGYLAALERSTQHWEERVVERGGRLVRATTTDDPVQVVRSVLRGAEGRGT